MASLETAFTTLKDKMKDNEYLSLCAECQTQANKIAIKDLTTDLGYVRVDVDLQKDRLDDYSGQLEVERVLWEGQGSKVDQLETTAERFWAMVQTLVEEGQQKEEKYRELARQVQVIYSMGWPRVVGTGEIITVGDDQNQV